MSLCYGRHVDMWLRSSSSFSVLVLCTQARCHGSLGNLNSTELSLTLLQHLCFLTIMNQNVCCEKGPTWPIILMVLKQSHFEKRIRGVKTLERSKSLARNQFLFSMLKSSNFKNHHSHNKVCGIFLAQFFTSLGKSYLFIQIGWDTKLWSAEPHRLNMPGNPAASCHWPDDVGFPTSSIYHCLSYSLFFSLSPTLPLTLLFSLSFRWD